MGIPVYQGNTYTATTTGTTNLGWPTHLAGDVGVLVISTNGYYDPPPTPAGWTPFNGTPVGVNVPSTLGMHGSFFWRRATSAAESNVAVTSPGGSTTFSTLTMILTTYRGCVSTGNPVTASALATATDDGGTQGRTGVIPPLQLTPYHDQHPTLVVVASAGEDNYTSSLPAVAGVTLTERRDYSTSSGYDSCASVYDGVPPAVGEGVVTILPEGTLAYSGIMYWAILAIELLGAPTVFTATSGPDVAPQTAVPIHEVATGATIEVGNGIYRVFRFDPASSGGSSAAAITPKHRYTIGKGYSGNTAPVVVRIPGPDTSTEVGVANTISPAAHITVAEAASFTETILPPVWGVYAPDETLTAGVTAGVTAFMKPVLSSALGVSSSLAAAWADALVDIATLSESLITARGMVVADALGLAPVMTPNTVNGVPFSDAAGFSDSLARFLGGALVDGLTLSRTAAADRYMYNTEIEGLTLAASSGVTAVLRVVTAEGLELSDAQLTQYLFGGTLTEEVIISLGTLDEAGDFTAWAMNTLTGGVTQYENYQFNSYAEFGNQYLGASSSGLYALDGDDDAGTDVVGTLRSGYSQFAGSKLAALDAAYIGVRGCGDFVFRLHTATGESYEYTATADSMRTARVVLGRGLRARYLAFELVSTGQDFDLDAVELIPLDLTRRV